MKRVNTKVLKGYYLLAILIFAFTAMDAQNFSGLQNKKLVHISDMGAMLESQVGSLLGGKIKGNIDSVIIAIDAEKTLRVKIYYTGFTNGFFEVAALNDAKKKQHEIGISRFAQALQPSPAECTLQLDPNLPKGTKLASAFLRIEVAKNENGAGDINIYSLNKTWSSDIDAQNVVDVVLQPVGKAAALSNGDNKDVMPVKRITFDPKFIYQRPFKPVILKKQMIKTGGGNSFHPPLNFDKVDFTEDISGTWINNDANTRGITKLIITNNRIEGFGKCFPQDCDWGSTSLISFGGNNFKAVFQWSFQTTTLNINYTGDQVTVNQSTVRKNTSGTSSNTYTFKKNLPVIYTTASIYTLQQAATAKANVAGQPVSKVPLGPNKNKQIYLLEGLAADVDFSNPQDISNININIYGDKNENSGVYYILPADYHLKWETKTEPENGFELRILYGSQKTGDTTDTGTDAPVRMSATLTAGIGSRERNFVKSLLKAYFPDFTELRFLPLKENPQFTFQNTLGAQYNIPQNKITVETNTDLTGDIHVAWQTDADTKEFIQTALTSREGIAASVILKPDDEEIPDQQIPAIINLADTRTLGKINLEPNTWRTRNWRNTTPFPLKLKYLHVLKKETNGKTPIIYSWSMNDATIPSQAQAAFDKAKVPLWLDNDPSAVMWIDYDIEDCSDCDKKVMDAVTGGVSGMKANQIKFTIAPVVFDSLHASYFNINVRSRLVDPKGLELRELDALKITNDAGKDFFTGPLFIPADGVFEFEYKITEATTDGNFYQSIEWIKGAEKEVFLGKNRMREIFNGIVPGIN